MHALQVLGNETLAGVSAPTSSFRLSAGEVLISLRFWSSRMAADAVGLSPLIAGFSWTTNLANTFTVGEPPELGLPDVRSSSDLSETACSAAAEEGCSASGNNSSSTASSNLAAGILAHAKDVHAGAAQQQQTGTTSPERQLLQEGSIDASSSNDAGRSNGDGVTVTGSQTVSVASGSQTSASDAEELVEAPAATAVWMPTMQLTKQEMGTGVVVGVAAFSSGDAIHALGMLFLDQPTKSEL